MVSSAPVVTPSEQGSIESLTLDFLAYLELERGQIVEDGTAELLLEQGESSFSGIFSSGVLQHAR